MSRTALRNRWNDPSGGLGYHWRARRYRVRLWQPYHARVAQWLAAWQPPCRTLVLVGPSAGYALSDEFIARFAHCVVLEPDPLARWLLKRRLGAARCRFETLDVFDDPAALAALGTRAADTAILFCNVIGQALDADTAPPWRARQHAALVNHHWASWHDCFSSTVAPVALPDADDIARGADASAEVARRLWAGLRCAVVDHGTFGWLPETQHALWHLAPHQWHVVGWGVHRPRST
ncbi:MAG: hypothetical protein KDF24_05130 [Rhodocyclaceae bacterium]|nr:hypothetical protein [Rhodocyclaceae bacterium]